MLALMLHPGYSGYAALDGWGGRAFGTSRLAGSADRASMLVRLVRRLARRLRPARVVLGIPARGAALAAPLRRATARACRALGLAVVSRPLRGALERLGAEGLPPSRNALARHLVGRFVPGLFHEFRDRLDRLWHRRPAWHAVALAVSELAEVSPMSAAALAPAAGHAVPAFARAVRHALAV